MQTRHPFTIIFLAAVLLVLVPVAIRAAEPAPAKLDRARLLEAAREIIGGQTYCALITIDDSGRPQVRTMNPFPPDEGMVVWMATNTRSLKVQQIRRDPRVALYYADHANATGYVTIHGRAELVDDMQEILKRRRAYWDSAFPGLKNLVLVKVVPERIDVVDYRRGALGDPATWRPPVIEFPAPAPSTR
jgi:general stress protein 26